MKFLADENVEPAVVGSLRALGHDVLTIGPTLRSRSDKSVLESARRAKRIVVTNDKDFAELAFRDALASAGIVLTRLPRWSGARKGRRVAEAVAQMGPRIHASLVVIEEVAVRYRAFAADG
jgi:predicted nuclease of predicted toxin-antitoxin system